MVLVPQTFVDERSGLVLHNVGYLLVEFRYVENFVGFRVDVDDLPDFVEEGEWIDPFAELFACVVVGQFGLCQYLYLVVIISEGGYDGQDSLLFGLFAGGTEVSLFLKEGGHITVDGGDIVALVAFAAFGEKSINTSLASVERFFVNAVV